MLLLAKRERVAFTSQNFFSSFFLTMNGGGYIWRIRKQVLENKKRGKETRVCRPL